MRVVMSNMNSNTKEDPSNLNIASNLNNASGHYDDNGGVDGAGGSSASALETTASSSGGGSTNLSNMEYLKNLADAMSSQEANGSTANDTSKNSSAAGMGGNGYANGNDNNNHNNNYQADPSSESHDTFSYGGNNANINQFINMQNAAYGSDKDNETCDQSYARRISRDSLVSRDSLSDMLSADQVASNNLAMMNMLANQQQQQQQQQQQMGGGGGTQNNNAMSNNFNVNGSFNGGNQGQGGQHQALNQSMSQLMMNGSMGQMNQMSASMGSAMMNNAMGGGGGWNANAANGGMNGDPLRGAYGAMNAAASTNAPLVIPPKKTKNKHKQTFAQKLMHILSIKECYPSIRWMPNGCAFCIVDSKELVEKVLPKYFKEAKYTSFTRKLNRWGFKHFTLPTSEPSSEKEMSIYTHEKFLRDNPALCQMMDGGHRRRNSSRDNEGGTPGGTNLGSSMTSQASTAQDSSGMAQLQQQNMMMQQMQQLQQQNMMMQQMQQHAMSQNQQMAAGQGGQGMGGQSQLFDMSALNTMGGGNNYNTAGNNNNNNTSNSLMGNQGNDMNGLMGSGPTGMAMRRTSLGFMPYLPASNRRDSGFSTGGLSAITNDLGGSFTGGAGASGGMEGLTGTGASTHSLRKSCPDLGGGDGMDNNATFDDYNKTSHVAPQGGGGNGDGEPRQEDLHHSQAKLAVLEDMIAKERRKQSLLSSLDSDPVTKTHEC